MSLLWTSCQSGSADEKDDENETIGLQIAVQLFLVFFNLVLRGCLHYMLSLISFIIRSCTDRFWLQPSPLIPWVIQLKVSDVKDELYYLLDSLDEATSTTASVVSPRSEAEFSPRSCESSSSPRSTTSPRNEGLKSLTDEVLLAKSVDALPCVRLPCTNGSAN